MESKRTLATVNAIIEDIEAGLTILQASRCNGGIEADTSDGERHHRRRPEACVGGGGAKAYTDECGAEAVTGSNLPSGGTSDEQADA